jgi:hypothetical protein
MATRAARRSLRSMIFTGCPARPARSATMPPIGPHPVIATTSPGAGARRRSACKATASGSAIARCRSGTPSGAAMTLRAGSVTDSAKPPSMTSPMKPSRSHTWPNPAQHAAHFPQRQRLSTITRWPKRTCATSGPIAVTVPTNSWPATEGARLIQAPVLKLCRSEPQMPAAKTASVTSPIFGGGGASISSTRKSRTACNRTARIRQPFR